MARDEVDAAPYFVQNLNAEHLIRIDKRDMAPSPVQRDPDPSLSVASRSGR
jgi:hypothetical protein